MSIGAIKDGFFFGMAGANVTKDVVTKDDKGNDVVEKGKIVGSSFAINGKDSKWKHGAIENLEAPYPETDEAAILMAADAKTTITVLRDGQYEEKELTGLAAAVTIAIRLRRDEAFRGRLRSGNVGSVEDARSQIVSCYTFALPSNSAPTFSEDDVRKAITEAIASGADMVEVMKKFGVKVA